MVAHSSALRIATFSSLVTLCFCTASARAEGGAGGGGSGGAATADSAGASAGGAAGSGVSTGGGGTSSGGMSAQGGVTASAGAGGASPTKLVTNGTFDSVAAPWWSYAANAADNPSDIVLAATDGQLCGTMMAGGKNVWDVIIGLSDVPLAANQYYHVSFSVLADAPRTIKFKTGLGVAPYTDYFIESIPITATAQTIDYTYLNLRTDPTAQLQFQVGKAPGKVCLDNIVFEQVPAPTTPTYKTSALSGHPLKDYKVLVKMGTAVDTPIFLSNPLHNAIVAGEFSMITPANSMKMNLIQPTQGTFDFTDTDALFSWAQTNGLEFRGHPLVWHTQVPDWLTTLTSGTFDRDQMIAIMYAHIDGLMGHYKGKFPYWDVVNEAIDLGGPGGTFRSTIWHDKIGDDFMDLAFTHAHAADPAAKLLYNDYNIEQMGDAKADKVFEVVKGLKARGVPIDAIGFQGHYYIQPDGDTSYGVPSMQAIRDNMARYAGIGVDVQVTESDFRIGKPLDDAKAQLQNKFYADFLQACIDAPNCSHFTVWGLSDVDSWVPSTFPEYDYAHLFDSHLVAKPAYSAMSQVFAKYNPADGSLIPVTASGGSGSGSGGSGSSSPGPVSSGSSGSSGGCSLAMRTTNSAPWLLSAFAMVGILWSRRRSSSTRR
jgi:endo-1,4-beta-xylanase